MKSPSTTELDALKIFHKKMYISQKIIMETPTSFIIRQATKYAEQSESFVKMLQDLKKKFARYEKEFIKKVYIDALKDVDLPQEEKARKAEEYYINNFKNID